MERKASRAELGLQAGSRQRAWGGDTAVGAAGAGPGDEGERGTWHTTIALPLSLPLLLPPPMPPTLSLGVISPLLPSCPCPCPCRSPCPCDSLRLATTANHSPQGETPTLQPRPPSPPPTPPPAPPGRHVQPGAASMHVRPSCCSRPEADTLRDRRYSTSSSSSSSSSVSCPCNCCSLLLLPLLLPTHPNAPSRATEPTL